MRFVCFFRISSFREKELANKHRFLDVFESGDFLSQNVKLEAETEFLSIVFLSLLWNGIYGKM